MFKECLVVTLGNKGCLFVLVEYIVILHRLDPGESAESPAGRSAVMVPHHSQPMRERKCAQVDKLRAPRGFAPPRYPQFPRGLRGPPRSPRWRVTWSQPPAPSPQAAAGARRPLAPPPPPRPVPRARASLLPLGSLPPLPFRRAPLLGPPHPAQGVRGGHRRAYPTASSG